MKRVWISCVGAGTSPKRGNVYFSNVGRVACPRRLVPVSEKSMPVRKVCGNLRNGTTVPYTAKRISCVGANCVRPRTGGDACPYAIPTVCLEIDLFFRKARREGDAVCRYSEPHAPPLSVSTNFHSRGIVKFTYKVNLRFDPRLTRRKKKPFFAK